MFVHVDRLIQEVETFLKSDNLVFIERLLGWARNEASGYF